MAEDQQDEVLREVGELTPFDPTKKKKKKVVIQDAAESEDLEKVAEKVESLSLAEGMDSAFTGKKKKTVKNDAQEDENGDSLAESGLQVEDDEEGEGIVPRTQYPWEGTTRNYLYEELLGRVLNILRESNPKLAGERRKIVMRPPQVLREGTTKTIFVNFMDLCKTMHRQPEHVMTYILAELGTNGNLDGQQRLVAKGRFAPKNFEGILRHYVNEYVMCNGCKGPDTVFTKENRLFFLRCEQCGCSRSVPPIKTGYVARVEKRKTGT